MKSTRLSILPVFLLTAFCAQAQWRSVHAVKTTTVKTTSEDGTVHTSTTTSQYYRSTSGSELTVTVTSTPDGMLAKKIATLYDANEPAQYSLDYGTKTAYLIAHFPAAKPFRTNRRERHPELQQAAFDGVDCDLLPIMLDGKRIGTVWIDDKDDLELKREIELPGAVTTTELSDITFDPKNAPGTFSIPAGFRIDTSRMRAIPTQP